MNLLRKCMARDVGRARTNPRLVVLDGKSLASDCRDAWFGKRHHERFIEDGIAGRDMVSMAGQDGAAGWLPVVNSFASFLAAANEQIYNNATEGSEIYLRLTLCGANSRRSGRVASEHSATFAGRTAQHGP